MTHTHTCFKLWFKPVLQFSQMNLASQVLISVWTFFIFWCRSSYLCYFLYLDWNIWSCLVFWTLLTWETAMNFILVFLISDLNYPLLYKFLHILLLFDLLPTLIFHLFVCFSYTRCNCNVMVSHWQLLLAYLCQGQSNHLLGHNFWRGRWNANFSLLSDCCVFLFWTFPILSKLFWLLFCYDDGTISFNSFADCLWIASWYQLEFWYTLVPQDTWSHISVFIWWQNWHL